MSRSAVVVQRVTPGDAVGLTELWLDRAVAGGMSQEIASRAANQGRIGEALRRPGTIAYVALHDGEPAGYAIVNFRNHGLLEPTTAAVDELYVLPAHRRVGIARVLLNAIATLAESEACEVVTTTVPTADKSTNRYFARLGFGTQLTRRVIPTAVLRRRLSEQASSAVDTLVGRRRTIRARARLPHPPNIGLAPHARRPAAS